MYTDDKEMLANGMMVVSDDDGCEWKDEDTDAEILAVAPVFPADGALSEIENWVWEFVRSVKDAIVTYEERGEAAWTPRDVKKCFIRKLKKERQGRASRRNLVKMYNSALGRGKFPPDWSCETVYGYVTAYSDTMAPLPKLNRKVFKNRGGYAKCYPQLLAAIYLAGTTAVNFPFAMKAYGNLAGCNQKTVWALIHTLARHNVLTIVKQGLFVPPAADGSHRDGQSSWYCLTAPESLLKLFLFESDRERDMFVRSFGTITNKFSTRDWGDYVITRDWLYANRML